MFCHFYKCKGKSLLGMYDRIRLSIHYRSVNRMFDGLKILESKTVLNVP